MEPYVLRPVRRDLPKSDILNTGVGFLNGICTKEHIMKKLLVGCLLIALVSGVVVAQDEPRELLFDPDTQFTVQDLGFTFLYPESWVYDTSDGLQFAENDADLAAEMDGPEVEIS